jgi:hypothetical protein
MATLRLRRWIAYAEYMVFGTVWSSLRVACGRHTSTIDWAGARVNTTNVFDSAVSVCLLSAVEEVKKSLTSAASGLLDFKYYAPVNPLFIRVHALGGLAGNR